MLAFEKNNGNVPISGKNNANYVVVRFGSKKSAKKPEKLKKCLSLKIWLSQKKIVKK